jgi:Spy/CpxP family protein refolding chaperone
MKQLFRITFIAADLALAVLLVPATRAAEPTPASAQVPPAQIAPAPVPPGWETYQVQYREQQNQERLEQLTEELDLTLDQQVQILGLFQDQLERLRAILQDPRVPIGAKQQALLTTGIDIRFLLTPEQLKELDHPTKPPQKTNTPRQLDGGANPFTNSPPKFFLPVDQGLLQRQIEKLDLTKKQWAQIVFIIKIEGIEGQAIKADKTLSQEDRQAKHKALANDIYASITAVLTPIQQQHFAHLRLIEELGLTDKQSDQIVALVWEGNKLSYYEIAANLALSEEQKQTKYEVMDKDTQNKIYAVLTPEQQKKTNRTTFIPVQKFPTPEVTLQQKQLTKWLSLTEEQQTEADALYNDENAKLEALAANYALSREENESKFSAIVKNFDDKLRALLTPEQQIKCDNIFHPKLPTVPPAEAVAHPSAEAAPSPQPPKPVLVDLPSDIYSPIYTIPSDPAGQRAQRADDLKKLTKVLKLTPAQQAEVAALLESRQAALDQTKTMEGDRAFARLMLDIDTQGQLVALLTPEQQAVMRAHQPPAPPHYTKVIELPPDKPTPSSVSPDASKNPSP